MQHSRSPSGRSEHADDHTAISRIEQARQWRVFVAPGCDFMNHNWLPSLAKKSGAALRDQRAVWKAYLAENKLDPKALLRDGVHLSAHGEWLMA